MSVGWGAQLCPVLDGACWNLLHAWRRIAGNVAGFQGMSQRRLSMSGAAVHVYDWKLAGGSDLHGVNVNCVASPDPFVCLPLLVRHLHCPVAPSLCPGVLQ